MQRLKGLVVSTGIVSITSYLLYFDIQQYSSLENLLLLPYIHTINLLLFLVFGMFFKAVKQITDNA